MLYLKSEWQLVSCLVPPYRYDIPYDEISGEKFPLRTLTCIPDWATIELYYYDNIPAGYGADSFIPAGGKYL